MQAAMDRLASVPRAAALARARRLGRRCCSPPLPFAAKPDRAPHQRRLRGPRLGVGGRRPQRCTASRAPSASRSPWCSPSSRARRRADVRARGRPRRRRSPPSCPTPSCRAGGGRRRPSARRASASIVVVPLEVSGTQDELADLAVDLRDELGDRAAPRRRAALPRRPAGALGRACRTCPRRTSSPPRRAGFPIVLLILLGGLRLAGRGRAAAGARLRQRRHHRRRHLLPLAGDRHVGVRDQRRLDDRHRRGGRLLAVRARALPRGDPRGAEPDRGAPASRCAPRASPWPSPASR